jgi:hypothetical protein
MNKNKCDFLSQCLYLVFTVFIYCTGRDVVEVGKPYPFNFSSFASNYIWKCKQHLGVDMPLMLGNGNIKIFVEELFTSI